MRHLRTALQAVEPVTASHLCAAREVLKRKCLGSRLTHRTALERSRCAGRQHRRRQRLVNDVSAAAVNQAVSKYQGMRRGLLAKVPTNVMVNILIVRACAEGRSR